MLTHSNYGKIDYSTSELIFPRLRELLLYVADIQDLQHNLHYYVEP